GSSRRNWPCARNGSAPRSSTCRSPGPISRARNPRRASSISRCSISPASPSSGAKCARFGARRPCADAMADHTHIVIGGGTYGCFTALTLAERLPGARIAVVEQEADLMRRASYNNQARVHYGYHYPRSVLTALRSRVNAPRFAAEFGAAIVSDFE